MIEHALIERSFLVFHCPNCVFILTFFFPASVQRWIMMDFSSKIKLLLGLKGCYDIRILLLFQVNSVLKSLLSAAFTNTQNVPVES